MICDHLSLGTSQHTKNTSSDDDSHPNGKCGHVSKETVKANKVDKKVKNTFLEINCMVYIQTNGFLFEILFNDL